ncbi:hypothetical protein C2S51_005754 [Perilla frutescens var. frutescens]|nr:hypothetical protein C2S51_005754 [Perilla frutescens var. frutescens]
MAPSTSLELPHLPTIHIRLDRSNYAFWRMQVLATIRAHGFTGFIDPSNVPPSQFLPTSSTGRCIPNPECHTTCDLWRVLESLFQSQSKARVMQLRFQLQTTRKDNMSVDDYFLKMRSFADLLAGAGHPIADDELILYILAGFGPEYEAIVVNLTHRSDPVTLQEDDGYVDESHAQWVVDSGATNHITNQFQNLSIHSAFPGDERLTVGNGQQIPIIATGQTQPQGVDERSAGKGIIQA